MPLDDFSNTLKQLMTEFQDSGMNIDDFIRQKLSAHGNQEAEEIVKNIDATLAAIDGKYASLQKFKSEGGNREEWLRQEIDGASKDIATDKTGQVLSSAIKVLNGDENDEPEETADYSGVDASLLIRDLDDAIVNNTCKGLSVDEEE